MTLSSFVWFTGTSMFATWSRKFFIVHEDSITCHEDHMKTSVFIFFLRGALTFLLLLVELRQVSSNSLPPLPRQARSTWR
jgi:hypothetical protein